MIQEGRRPAVDAIRPPTAWTDEPQRPPVVIAIPNWNRGELLRDCVESILRATAYPRYRVCIFDQGSVDSSRDYIGSWGSSVDKILATENVGYIPANNAIFDRYPDWDVLLLNNDTLVRDPLWLDALVSTAYSADDIGLVGAKLVYPDGRLQEAGSQLFRNGSARAYGKFEDPRDPAFNIRRDVDFCSAACLYVKRSVLRACGGFDASYSPCYYEDVDLALKARAAGYRTVYEPQASVIHREYGTSGKAFAAEQMIRNQHLLLKRWHDLLQTQPLSLWEIPSGDRRPRPQALLVGDATDRAAPARAQRSRQLLAQLADTYNVAYAHTDPATAEHRLRVPDAWAVTTFYPGFARAVGNPDMDLAAIVAQNRFRWVIFDSPRAAADYSSVARRSAAVFRVAIDVALADVSDVPGGIDLVLAGTDAQGDAIRRKYPDARVAIVSATMSAGRPAAIVRSALARTLAAIRGRASAPMAEILAQFEGDTAADAIP
jgi:GT2 family glycosyltransferase